MYKLIKVSDRVKFQASYAHKLTVKLQWESAEANMWNDESDYWAEHDWADIADTWDVIITQKC